MSRRDALSIFRSGLRAADPGEALLRKVKFDGHILAAGQREYDLATIAHVRVVGAGKASVRMGKAVERLLGSRIEEGWLNVPNDTAPLKHMRTWAAGHPVPDRRGLVGARKIVGIAQRSGSHDLLICLISGGASALLTLPAEGVTLGEKKEITRQLLRSGATIQEMNTVRKHVSAIKGGHLAQLAFPAQVLGLILSDVIGDDPGVIGSGPTTPDTTTCAEAKTILRKYSVSVPTLSESPKPGKRTFSHVNNVIIGRNRESVDAAAKKAAELGYRPVVLSTTVDGETREVALVHAAIAREAVERGEHRMCFISGGETTVTVRGRGKGGRSQEFVLAALRALEGTKGVTIFSASTDGRDGPTDAAGAVAYTSDPLQLDPGPFLENNDSYHFFEKTGGLIKTGPTGTNVMDIRILMT